MWLRNGCLEILGSYLGVLGSLRGVVGGLKPFDRAMCIGAEDCTFDWWVWNGVTSRNVMF